MINNITLMGRLIKDPELKTTTTGTEVTTFCIAVDRNYVGKGEERKADFINCVAWRQTATFISKYFTKGSMIALVGELQSRNYEDKDGNKRTVYEVIVSNVSFCGGKESAPSGTSKPSSFDEIDEINSEDLPF